MKRILLPILLLVAVLGTSCVSQHGVDKNYAAFRPDVVRLNMTMDDYQYLGDVTIEAEYKTYLGIFRQILTINGEPYTTRTYRKTQIAFNRPVRLGVLEKALYKVVDTYPEANYLLPTSSTDVVEHMTAGRIHKCRMTVKVYAVKNGLKH